MILFLFQYLLLYSFHFTAVSAQTWTWVSGEKTIGGKGVYGEIDVPSSEYWPTARTLSASATDSQGNLWIFGGATVSPSSGSFGDLWRFDGTNWTLVHGNNQTNTLSILSGNATQPGSRYSSIMWIDSNDTIWLFGGLSFGPSWNELWMFEDHKWTYVKGDPNNMEPYYGVKGEGTNATTPGTRNGAVGWVDDQDNLWLFGGAGLNTACDDLWRFNGTVWTWMGGTNNASTPLNDSSNPSPRYFSSGWKDPRNGYVWLFGGVATDGYGVKYMNDMWMFNGEEWTLIDPPNEATDRPIGRHSCAAHRDKNGNAWLFGGQALVTLGSGNPSQLLYCDLWRFSFDTRKWILERDCIPNSKGVYGEMNTSNSTLYPGARYGASAGIFNENLWIFGGLGYDSNPSLASGTLNDLWKFIPAIEVGQTTEDNKKKSVSIAIVTAIPIVGTLLVVFLIVAAVFFIKRRRKRTFGESDITSSRNDMRMSQFSPKIATVSDIVIGARLGGGQFGDVYRGKWQNTTDVALKKLKSQEHLQEFASEANMLQKLRHQHVVQFYGIYVADDGISYIVTEYLSNGSLDIMVKTETFSTLELVQFARDAGAGMLYLSQQNIIHRDLALRNLLVGSNNFANRKYLIKIADFGMSKSLGENQYYKKEDVTIPYRWCSPEVLSAGKYSTASDVWAFGVTLYELFSRGLTPYLGMTNSEVVKAVLDGQRLECPKGCPIAIYELMTSCWQELNARPSFKQIVVSIDDIIDSMCETSIVNNSNGNVNIDNSSVYLNN